MEDDKTVDENATPEDNESCSLNNTPLSETKVNTEITVDQACLNVVEKIGDYLNGELAATAADYQLIEKLNNLTMAKYDHMSVTTNELISRMEEINDKYKSLQPYLTQIDLLEESVLKLEKTAYKLDAYSKQLETKFKSMEKK